MRRERKIPSRSLFLNNEVTEVKKLINSEIILRELSIVEQSTPFNDGGYGKEIIKNTLLNLIRKEAINDNNLLDCMRLITKLSLVYIVEITNTLNDNIKNLEVHLNKHLADKELYTYEEDYLLSEEFPMIKSELISETLSMIVNTTILNFFFLFFSVFFFFFCVTPYFNLYTWDDTDSIFLDEI